jgi:hypothetical protein
MTTVVSCNPAVVSGGSNSVKGRQQDAGVQTQRPDRPGELDAGWLPRATLSRRCRARTTDPGVRSPLLWGTDAHLRQLFAAATAIEHTARMFAFRYRSREHWVNVFRTYYGPVHKAFLALDEDGQAALEADLIWLLRC